MSDEKVKRVPVTHQWQALNYDFLKLLAEIAHYASSKYGSAEQYVNGRLEGEKSPINHIYEHLREFQAGELHDHFGTLEHQLAAIAYGAMMEYAYIKMHGHAPNKVMAASRRGLVLSAPSEPHKVSKGGTRAAARYWKRRAKLKPKRSR